MPSARRASPSRHAPAPPAPRRRYAARARPGRARILAARGAAASRCRPRRSERSTYTRARDSSALMTSNDGFSVVAPMKVSVPSSTYGRNVSCCALLNRCTSSRNNTLRRPRSAARVARALDRFADVLDAGHDGRKLHEFRVGAARDEPRQRGLAGARRPPEDQRVQLPLLERLAQRLARSQHLLLADEFIESARPHAVGERPQRIVGRRVAQQVRLRRSRRRGSLSGPPLPATSGQLRPARQPEARQQQPERRSAAVRDHVAGIALAAHVAWSTARLRWRRRAAAGTTKIFHQRGRGTRPAK